jgi:hypothetical protein
VQQTASGVDADEPLGPGVARPDDEGFRPDGFGHRSEIVDDDRDHVFAAHLDPGHRRVDAS